MCIVFAYDFLVSTSRVFAVVRSLIARVLCSLEASIQTLMYINRVFTTKAQRPVPPNPPPPPPHPAPQQKRQNITDRGLRVASGLPSLTCLNASRCRGITVEGLACLSRAAPRLRRLNLGWCPGLAANRNRSGGVEGRRAGGVGGGIGRGGGENDDDDDDEEDDEDDLDVDGAGRGQLWEGGQQQRQVEIEGEEEKWDDGGRGRRREWALPPLPRLEDLCLARWVELGRGHARGETRANEGSSFCSAAVGVLLLSLMAHQERERLGCVGGGLCSRCSMYWRLVPGCSGAAEVCPRTEWVHVT